MASITGTNNNDVLTGTSSNDVINGLAGNDIIDGGGSNDLINGGDGNDSLFGSSGNDTLSASVGNDTLEGGTGNDSLNGGLGNDLYKFTAGWGTDTVNDSRGLDTLAFINKSGGVSFNMATNSLTSSGVALNFASGTVIESVILSLTIGTLITGNSLANSIVSINGADGFGADSFLGAGGNDTLAGNTGDDTLDGGTGSDSILGEDDDDSLLGQAGNDTLIGGNGDDVLNGGSGNDVYFFDFGFGNDSIADASGIDTIDLRSIDAGISADLTDAILIDGYDDEITITSGTVERLFTANGNDAISSSSANDYIATLGGDDIVITLGGNDTLVDGLGNDEYQGGNNNDTYVFATLNTNADFTLDVVIDTAGQDKLWMQGFETSSFTFAANDSNNDTFLDELVIQHSSGTWEIHVTDYFDNLETSVNASGQGTGALELISFKDDTSISFSEMVSTYITPGIS